MLVNEAKDPGRPPVIMHVDMDAFFVNVELLSKPWLRGKKVIVARNSPRSVVLSASYRARADGVRSAMPLAKALALSADSILIEPKAHYRQFSQQMLAILLEITDRVEQVSIDEAFVDLTGALRRLGQPYAIGQRVRQDIKDRLGLPASVGIAQSKFLAKMASSASKPDGLWLIAPHRVREFLDPMPVAKLWGVGPALNRSLQKLGVATVADLRGFSPSFLQAKFGTAAGRHLYDLARGLDSRPVDPTRQEKSMGAEHTFDQDTQDFDQLSRELYRLSLSLARRLRAAHKYTSSVTLKVRYHSFETLTRSCRLDQPSNLGRTIYEAVVHKARGLLLPTGLGYLYQPVRLVGVRAERLIDISAGRQASLLDKDLLPLAATADQQWQLAEETMDQIRQKYGQPGLLPAKLLWVKKAN